MDESTSDNGEKFQKGTNRRSWYLLSTNFHFVLHLSLLGAIAFTFAAYHWLCSNTYEREVFSTVTQVVKRFQIREDPDNNLYGLFFLGDRFENDASQDKWIESGISKVSPVVGYLNEVEAIIEESNRLLKDQILQIRGLINKRYEGTSTYVIPLQAVSGMKSYNSTGFVFDIAFDDITSAISTDLSGRRNLERIISSGECKSLKPLASKKELDKARLKSPKDYIDHIENSLTEIQVEECSEEFKSNIKNKLAEATKEIEKLKAKKKNSDSSCNEKTCSSCLSEFHCQVASLWFNEISFFWLFGGWKWLDIAFITMLGVMVEAMTRLGLHLANRANNGEIFNPGETWRTCLKLLYAPITSIAVIWTLLTTDILKVGVAGITGDTAIVTLAFIFGLFPNVPYSLLDRFAKAILQSTTIAGPPKLGQAEHVRVRSERTEKGSTPSFSKLKRQAKAHATAILKEDNL